MNNGMFGFPGSYVAKRGDGLDVIETGSGSVTIPDGVLWFDMILVGGGGGRLGNNGGASTFTYNGVTYTANGGIGAAAVTGSAGGTASGGDINMTGQRGGSADAGSGSSGNGGVAGFGGYSYGNGSYGSGGDGGGGGAGCCVARIHVKPGLLTGNYSIGAAGAGSGSEAGGGLLVISYLPPRHTI